MMKTKGIENFTQYFEIFVFKKLAAWIVKKILRQVYLLTNQSLSPIQLNGTYFNEHIV